MAIHQNLNISVKVNRTELVEALQRNKARHLEDFKKAVTVYHADLQAKLQELLEKSSNMNLEDDFHINLHKPVNNEKLYDKYIGMFSMSQDTLIEISSEDYGCIVDDNWSWAVSALMSNMSYSSKFRG